MIIKVVTQSLETKSETLEINLGINQNGEVSLATFNPSQEEMKASLGSDAPSFVSIKDNNIIINPLNEVGNFTFTLHIDLTNEKKTIKV